MYRHPYFGLWLHEDAALAALLGSPVVARTTLHEWPLSCVQRLRLADGRTRIYKAQSVPTVEPTFYACARSPLLVAARVLGVAEGPPALLLEDIAAPRLAELPLPEAEALRIGETILAQIAQIAGAPPAVFEIHTEARWATYAAAMLADLSALVAVGTFRQVDRALVARLARQAEAPAVLAALRTPTGYVHHDLSGDNVFVLPDGYRVIDWQRPFYGPVALDLVNLLDTLGFDPRQHVAAGIMQLHYLLRITWFVQCARTWFPPGATTYDAAVVRLAAQMAQVDDPAS